MSEQPSIRICVMGQQAAGKSTMIHSYVFNQYITILGNTILNDFSMKKVTLYNNKPASLQIWDIAAEERFMQLTRLYTRGAEGYMIVCSAESESFNQQAMKWKDTLYQTEGMAAGEEFHVPIYLVMAKSDLIQGDSIKEHQADYNFQQFSKKGGFTRAFKVSSKDRVNVNECFTSLVEQITKNREAKERTVKSPKKLRGSKLYSTDTKNNAQRGCCS